MRCAPHTWMACEIDSGLRRDFPLHHVTIQIDPGGAPCYLADDSAI